MKPKDLLLWGGLAIGGFLVYRYITKTAAAIAPRLAPAALNRTTDLLTQQIAAGTYDAQGQRLAGYR